MDELKQEAIKNHYANLVKSISSLSVMDHLAHLLSSEEMELIGKPHLTSQNRTRELIAILFRKNEELRPFERFIKALEETDESHKSMAKDILRTYKHDNGAAEFERGSRTSLSDAGKVKYDLQIAQQSLKEMYLTRFQKVRPFSLPFMFDIENTWVSLALKEEKKDSQAMEDHAELLEQAFKKAKMLIIEGDPATGKTSLMRRLAYEWARQREEKRESKFLQLKNWVRGKLGGQGERKGIQLQCYDLVLYAEFREVREETFQNIAQLVLHFLKKYLATEGYENLKKLMNSEKYCKECRILVLLDGYDESSLEKQCSELKTYINEKMINKALLFNTVVTTRKGYLSTNRDVKGRFTFAEVLGFKTMTQKEKYIFKHFLSKEIDSKENISAVHSLLANNENLDKLAETPLFLTFICLVYEKIVDGTLVELYCNIIRWLIDRHQQDNPDRDVPALFGYQSDSAQASKPLTIEEKQSTIRNSYLQFPQLLCLGRMALNNLKKDIFKETDFNEFNIKPIIHQVGLIRKDEFYDQSWNPTTTFCFPHRTIQEFLAAFYCLCSDDPTDQLVTFNPKLNTSEMKEFEKFLSRFAISDKMPVQREKRKCYFERIANIKLDITFDAFNTTTGFNNELLNSFLSQCTNVQNITFYDKLSSARQEFSMVNDASIYNRPVVSSKTFNPTQLSFSDLTKLHLLTFDECTFEANSQLSFKNCISLKNLQFNGCEIQSSTKLDIATLPAINIVEFNRCYIDLATWQSISDAIKNSSVRCLKLKFDKNFNRKALTHLRKCKNVEKIEITVQSYTICQDDLDSFNDLMKLHLLTFDECIIEDNSQPFFTNCPSLKNLKFERCKMKSSINLSLATLPSIDTVEFRICAFGANSHLSFTNCPSLKNLQFRECQLKSSTTLDIATLPTIYNVEFWKCTIDLATWQSIFDTIRNSTVKVLKLSADYFAKETYPEFLNHLQECERIEEIHVMDVLDEYNKYILNRYEEEVTANLEQTAKKLPNLRSIILDVRDRRLEQRNKERIEKAGQERYPEFSIKYVNRVKSVLEK